MGQGYDQYDTWSIYILTSHENFEKLSVKKQAKKRKLFNGFIKLTIINFGAREPKRSYKLEYIIGLIIHSFD